jgi:hypothetical protein
MEPAMNWLRRRLGLQGTEQMPVPATTAPMVADLPDPEMPFGPPVPFAPQGDLAPLFFLHIPKTSGSSVNRLLQMVYGEGNLISHAEYLLPKLLDRTEPTRQVDCVSAHFPLCRWALYAGSDAYARATILRDPWQRLVSHVNWTNRFNHGEALPTSGRGHAATRRVVEALAGTDFQRRDSLQQLFDLVQAEPDFILFDNLQVRMLTTGHPKSDLLRPDASSLRRALRNLRKFAVWGICEDQTAFQARLLAAIGSNAAPEPFRENVGLPLALTPDNDLARQIFAPWIELDQVLYNGAIFAQATRDRRARQASPVP